MRDPIVFFPRLGAAPANSASRLGIVFNAAALCAWKRCSVHAALMEPDRRLQLTTASAIGRRAASTDHRGAASNRTMAKEGGRPRMAPLALLR